MEKNIPEIISKLKAFNDTVNGKMGVSCLRSIILYLERGDIDSAKTVAENEFGKLWQYGKFGLPQYVNKVFELELDYFGDIEIDPCCFNH